MRKVSLKFVMAGVSAIGLTGCATVTQDGRTAFPETRSKAFIPDRTQTQTLLAALPAPDRPVAVAVYGFSDQTGQFKPSETGQTLSRAVRMLQKTLERGADRRIPA